MLLEEKDKGAFKQWLLPKLETISDADAAVLADYVIALITADGAIATVKQECVRALSDFLHEHTRPFVDEVVQSIERKSWKAKVKPTTADPAPKPPMLAPATAPILSIVGTSAEPYLPSPALNADARTFHPRNRAPREAPASASLDSVPRARNSLPGRPVAPLLRGQASGNDAQNGWGSQSRKRRLGVEETSQAHNGQHSHQNGDAEGERPRKMMARRGRGAGRGGVGADGGNPAIPRPGQMPGPVPVPPVARPPALPVPPGGILSLDPGFLTAMAASLGSAFPQYPPGSLAGTGQRPGGRSTARCNNYDTIGYCLLGPLCPFDHSPERAVPEYDPDHASLAMQSAGLRNTSQGKVHHNVAFPNGGPAADRGQAPLSLPNSTDDRTNTILVIDQIPQSHFSAAHVRGFFSQFGHVEEVQMQPYKRLAVVKFEDHASAQRAYDSPKVVFDNRFVKVYWGGSEPASMLRNSNTRGVGESNDGLSEICGQDEGTFDAVEFGRQQAKAQKAFEERRKKHKEAEAKAKEIAQKLEAKENEVQALRLKLLEKARAKGIETINKKGDGASDPYLSNLAAQAQDYFVQRGSNDQGTGVSGAHRGGFQAIRYGHRFGRGRGAYRGRGRGLGGDVPRSSVKRLDNRSKRLAIAKVQAGSKTDEAVREYLRNFTGCENVHRNPNLPHALIVCFAERYQAEIFVDEASNIPDVGKLDLFWVPNGVSAPAKPTEHEPSALHCDTDSGTEEEVDIKFEGSEQGAAEPDLDVAEEDQWL